jgi:hypothetical protein
MLVAITAIGIIGVTKGLSPAPVVIVQPEGPRSAAVQHPPARVLSAPANAAPESVVRSAVPAKSDAGVVKGAREGNVTTLTITTPVFEIDRRYRSMEGPHAEYDVRLDTGKAPGPHELLWWKGARIEVLDESGKPIGQEFMCHLNINVDTKAREQSLGVTGASRLLTLTQGELDFELPRGHAVPVSSNESWNVMFQVLNHNRDGKFRVKQRLTLFFIRDLDLFAPIDPLTWHAGSLWVPLDKSNAEARALDTKACHCCLPLERALEATNNVMTGRLVDEAGRTLVGHWVVPPGTSTWSYPLARYVPSVPKERRLFATWTHVHPFAREVRISAHKPGCTPQIVTKSWVESEGDGRVGLKSIRSLSSIDGEIIPADATLEIAVDYDNTSGRPQDSMTSMGMFVEPNEWKRPEWASRAQDKGDMDSCGLEQ